MVAENSSKLKGKFVEIVGHYLPTSPTKEFVFDKEAVTKWLSQGVQPSNTVAKLLNANGFDLPVHQNAPRKPRKEPKEEPKAAPAPAAEEAPVEAPAEEAPAEASEAPAEEAAPEAPAEEAPVEEEKPADTVEDESAA